MVFQKTEQINGRASHETIDNKRYSTKSSIITGMDVYCEQYGLVGKIDVYDISKAMLVERKKKVKKIYDGHVFQLFAQYYSLCEMGYPVKSLRIHSVDDNKNYDIELPINNPEMLEKFQKTITEMRNFDLNSFEQNNAEKCKQCIYEPACDRSLVQC